MDKMIKKTIILNTVKSSKLAAFFACIGIVSAGLGLKEYAVLTLLIPMFLLFILYDKTIYITKDKIKWMVCSILSWCLGYAAIWGMKYITHRTIDISPFVQWVCVCILTLCMLFQCFKVMNPKVETENSDVIEHMGDLHPDKTFYVIRRKDAKVGLLSYFITNIGHIRYAIEHGYIPIIDMQNYKNLYLEENQVGKENAWEYYFEQPYGNLYSLDKVYRSKNVILSSTNPIEPKPDDSMDFLTDVSAKKIWYDIYRKYCCANQLIQDEVAKYEEKLFVPVRKSGERILGVCLRGTDYIVLRPKDHPIQIETQEAIQEIRKAMMKWNCDKIYLVTEDKHIDEALEKAFQGKILRPESKQYDYSGSGYIGDVHLTRERDQYERGKEYLTAVLLLTKCDCFMGGRTSGTVAMHVMSEGFEHERFFNLGRY